jgi:flagellar hook-associated protein 3 FlgL
MRITFQAQYRDSAAAVEKTSEQLLDAQRRVSSGRRLNSISDDPTAAATSIAERSALAQVDQYTRTADSVASRLAVVDTALTGIVEKLTSARVTALAARGSTKTAAERSAAVQELASLRDALVDDLNTSFRGNYLFGGSDVTTKPYAAVPPGTVPAYNGSNTAVQVDIGNDRAVSVAFDGEAITRGADTQDVFETIDNLIAAVSAADSDAIGTELDALQRAFDRATAAQARIGNDMQAIDGQKLRLQQMRLSGAERISKLEDADMAEAITEMSHADAAYRAALGAVGTVTRVSLLDYLK